MATVVLGPDRFGPRMGRSRYARGIRARCLASQFDDLSSMLIGGEQGTGKAW